MSPAWNEGGKEECFDRMQIAMTHDELSIALGSSSKQIEDAGFVLVPRRWSDDALNALSKRSTAPTLLEAAEVILARASATDRDPAITDLRNAVAKAKGEPDAAS